jgi:hypothetical protein
MIRPHWTTEIRRAITLHFHTAAGEIPMYIGEDQKTTKERWAELKVYGPFYTDESDGQTTIVNVQVRIGCAINTQTSENIYDIIDMLGLFAAAASENILVQGITNPNFCLNKTTIRTIERGFVQTKVPLKVGYVEVDLRGIIEQERIIEA